MLYIFAKKCKMKKYEKNKLAISFLYYIDISSQ